MNKLEYIQKSNAYLGRLVHEIKAATASGYFDINTVAEDFFVPILAELYNCSDLRNQNQIKMNFPAVDLGCRSSRISFQVTSDPSSAKVAKTLKKFRTHGLDADFDHLYILVITEKQANYTSKLLQEQVDLLPIEFSVTKHIIDYQNLASKLSDLDVNQLEKIYDILEREFAKKDVHLEFRSQLEKFLEFSQSKLEVEKRTKKYIPSIFVETTSAKEQMRFFANPMFFYRRIDDAIERIDLSRLNELLELAKVSNVESKIDGIKSLPEANTLVELESRLQDQRDVLCYTKDLVSSFSWRGKGGKKYEPSKNSEVDWEIFRYPIEAKGSSIDRQVDEVISEIDLTQAKIFLITGMAGQGKTNFVCDLIENQFSAFEIPSIFIPARVLNDYPAPNRILAFITNNRYAPKVSKLHDLLELLNNIAMENQKPFIIAIDGINEVGALDEFNAELKIFLEAVCQYDLVKVILTCRSEFFDHKFAEIFNEPFSEHLHRIQDLRSKMSKESRRRMLRAYFEHFSISLRLSKNAAKFLKNDLILLRIFCEIKEGAKSGYVSEIYKGDIFEAYLQKKIRDFPIVQQQHVLRSLYKIAEGMLDSDNYSQLSTQGFEAVEIQIIEQLIAEDVVLRRELPDTGLSSVGIENMSFTYDELRDFIIAYYVMNELSGSDTEKVENLFKRLPHLPIYEGVFRYIYVLARKSEHQVILGLCEGFPDFLRHYIDNLPLLSAEVQNEEDVARVQDILSSSQDAQSIRSVAWFIFRRRDEGELLNAGLLVNHINGLPEADCRKFLEVIFSSPDDFQPGIWRRRINDLLGSLLELPDDEKISVGDHALAFALQVVGYADWEERENIFNCFSNLQSKGQAQPAIELASRALSDTTQLSISEITASRAET
ncbi:hypothetical protein A9Q96_08360 [Rhodobacterales bacterium 52_120_T64]|nr:hypothetical protein A9Q96_08360 [Rhodobacterales bacterium 52_120_T64]